MIDSLESDVSVTQPESARADSWLKVGAIAAVSALAGGLAAAWWYRNTLKKLHQAAEPVPHPDYGITGDDSAD
jgi:hypothetical protein